eukprot:NODE_795_length_1336_cov_259.575758_g603_i0.p1 GENE.NODE_795_length_1336_cov_259.575758_g603_i0~~NODE_795_length_1336_cov_259.575758_g603_i0.p1  ORF type:complete len:379 (-),score=87.70 NODE_795_length_1336_cov_259.575758_g603_i0:132-1268(-)
MAQPASSTNTDVSLPQSSSTSQPTQPSQRGGGTTGEDTETCEAFARYGFCSYGWDCAYAHHPEHEKAPKEIEVVVEEMIKMGTDYRDGTYLCRVCGELTKEHIGALVGVTHWFQYCPLCGNFYFYPHAQQIVYHCVESNAHDYVGYKQAIDGYCARLPPVIQIPFKYEAHRWGVSRFAWSIFGAENAKQILDLLRKQEGGELTGMISMGAGTGYVEFVIQRSVEEMDWHIDINAFDENPPKHCHFPVQKGTVEQISEQTDLSSSFLLLCWPPFGGKEENQSTMGSDALAAFTSRGGKFLVYIGDPHATGDWRFHEDLWKYWKLHSEVEWFTPLMTWVPQHMGLIYGGQDSIGVYSLRAVPLEGSKDAPITEAVDSDDK